MGVLYAQNACAIALYDGFAYPTGKNVGPDGGSGWDDGWNSTDYYSLNITSGGLEYGDLPVSGNKLTPNNGDSQNRSFRQFPETLDSGTIWISFLARTDVNGSDSGFAHISLLGGNGWESQLAIGKTSYNGDYWALGDEQTSVETINTTFLVTRIDFNASNVTNENIYLWANPSLDSEPSIVDADATLLDYDNFSTWRLRILQGGSAVMDVDEIRLGGSWEDVTTDPAVPEPGSFSLLVLLGFFVMAVRRAVGGEQRASRK